MPALENGSIDMVTDYTGMLAPQVLHLPMDTNPERVYDCLLYTSRQSLVPL